jgi:AhpD family alkylhydroperoxidase
MARLEPRRPHGLDLFRRLTFRAGRRMYGTEMEPSAIIAHSKPSLFGYGMIGVAHQRSKAVPHRFKNIAMLRTAQLTGCEWCLDFGSMLAQNSAVPADDLRELSNWRTSPRFDELDRLVLGYAEAMTGTPVKVTDEQFAALRAHFDEEQMVELTLAIAAENLFCRTNWALGIEGEGFSDGMYCVLPDTGAAGVDLSPVPASPPPQTVT